MACAFYLEGGIRGCEIGSLMFDNQALLELYRMAIPRRMYTQSHVDYVVEVAREVAQKKDRLRGFRVVEAPVQLRHFSARLEPL